MKTDINRYEVTAGETIEMKVRRLEENKEPITDGKKLIYTERKDGVRPETDIRTDWKDVALTVSDAANNRLKEAREKRAEMKVVKNDEKGAENQGNDGSSPNGTN